jgi:lysophospholipase L1-like esterase
VISKAVLFQLALAVALLAQASDKSVRWVGTWACSPQLGDDGNAPPEPGFHDSTLRQVVRVSLGGEQIRVRLSNAFGATPLTLPAVHIALAGKDGTIQPGTDRTLRFHGQPRVTIPAGALVYSDPLDFHLAPLADVAITLRLTGVPDGITTHPGSRTTSYLEAGDAVSAAEMANAARVDHWYYINGIDVMAPATAAAVVTLGDSITDGAKSTTNANDRWPDGLARRLLANKSTKNVAVLNAGIGGNRLLHDRAGPNALARFDRDVLAQSGVRWLIVLEGINDLGTRVSAHERNEQAADADDLIAALDQIIVRAHAHKIRVYGATILPYEGAFYFTPDGEADRQKVNQWIRTSGKFDAVIDFDATTRDPKSPSRLSAAADSGDHLHPAAGGYKIMSDSINLGLFEK